MLSVILVPAFLAGLAHSSPVLCLGACFPGTHGAPVRGAPLDRTLGELDSNAKACLDGLKDCKDDYENGNSTTGKGAYDTCVEKLTKKYGQGCVRPKEGNLNGALYGSYPKVASERRCRELANLHHRPVPAEGADAKFVEAWSWGRLKGQAADSNPICQLHTSKGDVVHNDKEYMVWGLRI